MDQKPRSPLVTALLAGAGALLPLSGWHKFYLGQYGWGLVYLGLSCSPLALIPQVASALEALWYFLTPRRLEYGEAVQGITAGIRELDRLRAEGLITELEFEQKRRHLLEQIH